MIRQQYIDFIEKFEGLSPYELDHISTILFRHYQEWNKKQPNDKTIVPTSGDLKELLIKTLRETHFSVAELKVEDAKMKLEALKAKYFAQS